MKNRHKIKLMVCLALWFSLVLCLGWTNTLKTNTPAGTDDPREADDRMRETKAAFVERLDVDHYFTASSTSTYDAADTGKHEFITLIDMASDPSQVSGYAHIYMKGDELFYQDDTDTTCQLTKDGFIEWESINDVNNATWIKSVDAAGTGTVNLIKADANDEQILPDGIRLETDTAPVQDEDVANKKYVDAHGLVQLVNTQSGTVATGTTQMPFDDSIPQNTEGDEYMTLAITPTSATNKLKIEVVFNYALSVANDRVMTVALFQDTTANALAAVSMRADETANYIDQINFTHYMTTGTTSETTFKVRAGINDAGTTTFNGEGGSRKLGGVLASSITIMEINP